MSTQQQIEFDKRKPFLLTDNYYGTTKDEIIRRNEI